LLEGKTKAMYYFFTQTCQDLPLYEEVLQQSNIPVAVIWGQHDEFLLWEPQKNAVIKDMKISEENIHIIDAKHFIQEEQPAALVQFIQEFCRK
jgi:pimeloyl-ACP methyl ester carboxylesterase